MIVPETLREANSKMVGNTSRTLLLTTVSLAEDAPCLSKLLAYLQNGVDTPEAFAQKVREQLTVRSFQEFIDKFKPCYFYRLRPAEEHYEYNTESEDAHTNTSDFAHEDGADGVSEAVTESSDTEEAITLGQLPYYEFSLEGGPESVGWRKVSITMDHPYLLSLQKLVKERALLQRSSFQVSVDSALFGFKPRAQHLNAKRKAQDLAAASDRLMMEMRRNPNSPDTKRALEAYDKKVAEMENAIGDEIRQLPIIAYGLSESLKALSGRSTADMGLSQGDFVLALGERGRVVAKPRELPESAETLKALDASRSETGREIVRLTEALESRPLAKREVREIAQLPPKERYPALVGSFMSEMIRLGRVNPLVGNVLAVVMQDPKQLAEWSVDPKEVAIYHDTFLGIYSTAVENFLRAVAPLFETLMGVYLFFNEFPVDARDVKPELIVANDELSDLWQFYGEEFTYFLRVFCHQANNQYQNAIGFAIVPSVQPLLDLTPPPVAKPSIRAGVFEEDYRARPPEEAEPDRIKLDESIEALRRQRIQEGGGFGRATEAGSLAALLELAYECGFVVFFSPEERLISGRITKEVLEEVVTSYIPRSVSQQEWAMAGVMCIPDFSILPPDGVLITGKVSDGREVGVEVPEVSVRGCYVAAGRFAANDYPKVLSLRVTRAPKYLQTQMKVRANLPGVGIDLNKYPYMGETNLATDHFTEDFLMRQLIGPDKPFLVFAQVSGKPPYIAQAHTMHWVERDLANPCYVPLHHYRQRVYLKRLLYAAHALGRGGGWPDQQKMQDLMDNMIQFMQWYDINKEGYVNAFPSELEGNRIRVEPIEADGSQRGYHFKLPFADSITGEMEFTFE
ncbi:MAG: hypothetical protein QW683_08485 [Candidatus Caldarchaeum sp.]